MRLNKTQKYAIEHLLNQNKTSVEIAKELSLEKEDVEKFIEKHSKVSTESTIPTTSAKVTSKDAMITQTQNKKINNVAIMTREAAEMNDQFKKSVKPKSSQEGIFRPKQ
jgi:DNA-directed RNA polymerase specialized sigma subunit